MGSRVVRVISIAAAAVWLLLVSSSYADESLFASDSILEIELHGPLAATTRDRKKREERQFELRYADQVVPVAVRVRGKSRAEYCRFPPLRIKVPDSEAEHIFAGMGKIKLVTHCRDKDSDEQNVLEEFAAYQMFAMISDVSLRVRLVRVKYVDTNKPKAKKVERYGFLLEPLPVLAERVNAIPAKSSKVFVRRLNLEQAENVFVFNYLISNTDWSLVAAHEEKYCCHNGELLNFGEQDYLVPYDFDQSGLVNPRYARPAPSTGQRTVRSRRYRGYCFDDLDLEGAITRIAQRRSDIESLVRTLPFTEQGLAEEHVEYLGAFFTEAETPQKLAAKFAKQCIG